LRASSPRLVRRMSSTTDWPRRDATAQDVSTGGVSLKSEGMDPEPNTRAVSTSPSKRRDIRDLLLPELEQVAADAGQTRFRAGQIAQWLYACRVESFDAMTNLPTDFRQYLKLHFNLCPLALAAANHSADDTIKLLLRLEDGREIESVIIPAPGRVTLCISSQAGCAMNCAFCATAKMGLERNLTAAEIVGQVIAASHRLEEGQHLTNYVFMGMGEPLANYPRLLRALTIMTAPWGMGISPRRVTVSTVGLVPLIEKLMAETSVHLAVSLTATTNELRNRLAPINRRYPLEQLIETCRRLDLGRRRITFEYVMLAGVNDSPTDAARLARLLAPLRAKVNLIFFNHFAGSPFAPSPRKTVERFQAILFKANLTATIRESRGQDIAAACGQLRVEHHDPRHESGGSRRIITRPLEGM
jgi:23S rRNA (adenine2503-C2)-methyltransferase